MGTLILDEGDQLLDAGFRAAIERILKHLPPRRQSLCFSATVPPSLAEVLDVALAPGHAKVDCVGEEQETHDEGQVRERPTAHCLSRHTCREMIVLIESERVSRSSRLARRP